MMEALHIAISGINASDNPAPGTGVARSLLENEDYDYKLFGLAYDALEPGIYMNWLFDRSFIVPYPTASHEALMGRLLYVQQQVGMDVVIPTLDSELPFYISNAERLKKLGIHCFLPTEEQFQLRSKERLSDVAEQAGILAPEQRLVSSQEELIEATQSLGFPVMVKGTLYKAYAAYTLDSALVSFGKIAAEWGFPVIVQKMVKGEELNIIGVGDGEGEVVGLVAARKMSVTEMGKIWTGVTVKHPEMEEATRKFVKKFKWRGAFEFECMVDEDDIYLIEINPRFPAWVYLSTGVGVNLPAMLVKLAMGKEVEPVLDYPAGKMFVRYTTEQVSDMNQFQNMVTGGEA